MSDGGKGSDRRPGVGYGDGWERIFGKGSEKPAQGACGGDCSKCIDSAPTSESKPDAVSAMCVNAPQGALHIATAL